MNGNGKSNDPAWVEGFFEALSQPDEYGRINASKAADMAGVHRSLVYRRRRENPAFRVRWDETALLCLENEKQRRLRRVRLSIAIE